MKQENCTIWVSHFCDFQPKGGVQLVSARRLKLWWKSLSLSGLKNQRTNLRNNYANAKWGGIHQKQESQRGESPNYVYKLCTNSNWPFNYAFTGPTVSSLAKDEITEVQFDLIPRRWTLQFESNHINCLFKRNKTKTKKVNQRSSEKQQNLVSTAWLWGCAGCSLKWQRKKWDSFSREKIVHGDQFWDDPDFEICK